RDDELFLRENLPNRRFRHLKRHRIRVTVRYVGRVADNAAVIMRLGETARFNPDPEVARAAAQVLDLAAQIRLQCLLAFAKLAAEFAVPSLQLTPATLAPAGPRRGRGPRAVREPVLRGGAPKMKTGAPPSVAI